MIDLEQCGTWIPDARSMIPEFSLIEVVYLTKIENRSKKFLTSLKHYCFDLSYHFCQKMLNFAKTILKLAKIKGVPYLRTKFLPQFYHHPTLQNEPPKSPPRLGLILHRVHL